MTSKALTPAANIVGQIIEMGNGFEIDIPKDINEIKARIIRAEVNNVLSAVEAGVYYNHLKQSLKHGEFMSFLKDVGVPQRRANEQISVAKLFKKLNSSKWRTSATLENEDANSKVRTSAPLKNAPISPLGFNLSQLIELTRLPEEQLEQLEDEQLIEFSSMPVKQLRLTVKDICQTHQEDAFLVAENAKLKRKNKDMDLRLAELINEFEFEKIRKSPDVLFDMPVLMADMQANAPAISEDMIYVVAQFVHMVEQVTSPTVDQQKAAETAAVLSTFMTGPFYTLHYALNRLKERFPDQVGGEHMSLPKFSESHWEEAIHRRQMTINNHEVKAGRMKKEKAQRDERRMRRGG